MQALRLLDVAGPHTSKNSRKRNRYYVCTNAQKLGWKNCPSKSIPAAQIEQLVVQQIQCIGRDADLRRDVLDQARQQEEARTAEMQTEQRGLEKDLSRWHAEVQKLSGQIRPGDDNNAVIARLADLQERIGLVEGRLHKLRELIKAIQGQMLDEDDAEAALTIFEPVWNALTPHEQARVVQLLVEQAEYDGANGKVAITFHPSGIKTLPGQLASESKEKRA